jgi:hypothetical protein
MHRGYTSEAGGHASCPFDFYKTWVNAPDKARAVSEALTRDADAVEDASNVTQVHLSAPAFQSLHAYAHVPSTYRRLHRCAALPIRCLQMIEMRRSDMHVRR